MLKRTEQLIEMLVLGGRTKINLKQQSNSH